MSKIRITLKRSPHGRKPSRSATLDALGLRKINQSVVVESTPQIKGMTQVVRDLITVEEAS